ncbi:MAG: FlgD immunoglobulin-like domain containing protein [Candidatus Eisenbacteria bacterium]
MCLLFAAPARAYDPITWYTFDGGGAIAPAVSGYRLSGTIGQPDAGTLSELSFSLQGGFWRGGLGSTVGVPGAAAPSLPFRLHAAMPNPTRHQARLSFDLPTSVTARLRVHDVSGRVVQAQSFGRLPAGHHERSWIALDDRGGPLPGGIYFIRLEAGALQAVRRVVVVH